VSADERYLQHCYRATRRLFEGEPAQAVVESERALEAAADGVETWPRILLSCLGVAVLFGLGVLWIVDPDVPGWWPLDEKWWLPGGWTAGVSIAFSGLIALSLIVYSIRHFREIKAGDPTP
jgi:hypothetical protein